jgi:hypothetical protein
MTQVHPKFGMPMTSLQYAQEWQESAEAFFSASHYNWMSEQLGDAKRVIEVGCGSGASTEALVRTGRQVLVIESNQHCAEIADGRLSSKGIAAELISADRLTNLLSWDEAGVKLLVEDVLSTELEQRLPHGWFDAIVCWMTGSNPEHIGIAIGKPYMQFDGSEMPMYRSKVQERCYELGLLAMKSGGIVHVVDRAAIRSWADKDQMRLELAKTLGATAGSRYSLTKSDCFLRKLTEGLNQSSIQYMAQVPPGFEGVLVLTSARAHLA